MSLILPLLELQDEKAAQDAFVAGVAALLWWRTATGFANGGREAGTFTENTEPTYNRVLELMDQAARDLDTEIGPDIEKFPRPDTVKPLVLSLLKQRTAMLIELGPSGDANAYDRLERMYDKRLKALVKAAAQAGAGDVPGSVDDAAVPFYSFPAAPSSQV